MASGASVIPPMGALLGHMSSGESVKKTCSILELVLVWWCGAPTLCTKEGSQERSSELQVAGSC